MPIVRPRKLTSRVWIMAIRDIAAGEELCYDYCLYDGDDEEAPCNCGAKKCRGSMYSAEELRRRKRLALKRAKQQAAAKKKKAKVRQRKRNRRESVPPPERLTPKPAKNFGKEDVAAEDFACFTAKKIRSHPQERKKSPRKVVLAARQSSENATRRNGNNSCHSATRRLHPGGWLKRYNRRAGQLATHFEIFRSTTLWLIKF